MLPETKIILYATGLGAGAPHVLRHALKEAEKHEAKVIVLHVIEPLNPFGEHLVELHISPERAEDIRSQAHEYVKQKAEERARRLCETESVHFKGGKDLIDEIRVVQGQPHVEIINQARAAGADLIIIGSHRHSAIGEVMLGHTASRVVHRSDIPVLLVRVPEGHREEGL